MENVNSFHQLQWINTEIESVESNAYLLNVLLTFQMQFRETKLPLITVFLISSELKKPIGFIHIQ